MSIEWIIAILTIALTGMTAAFLVTYDKWDEEKEKTEEAQARSRAELEMRARKTEFWRGVARRRAEERDELQDRLSEVLCPRNNHIWEPTTVFDGASRCKRCGRIKNG